MELKQSDITKIIRSDNDNKAEERFQKFLLEYPLMNETVYFHKREQLYLMLQQERTDKFIEQFFKKDANISSVDLDFIRSMTNFASEDFVSDYFYKKEFTIDQAKEIMQEHLVNSRFDKLPQVEQLIRENAQLVQRFDMQMEFLKKEREQTKTYSDELLKKEKEKHETEKELLQVKFEREIEILNNKANALEEENTILKRVPESERLSERQQTTGSEIFKKRCRKQGKRMERERDNFIVGVLSNPAFKPGQLTVIMRAVEEGLPLEALKKICVPDLNAKGMETLERFYLNKEKKEEAYAGR